GRGGHDVHGRRSRYCADLHWPRADGDLDLCARWLLASRSPLERGGTKVFTAGSIFVGHLCLRAVASIRSIWQYESDRDSTGGVPDQSAQSTISNRRADNDGGPAVQDCRDPVPSVGARRL